MPDPRASFLPTVAPALGLKSKYNGPVRSWPLPLVLLAASCGPGVVELELPPPPDSAQSMLTGVWHDDRLQVSAVDLNAEPSTWSLPVVEQRRTPAQFFAMFYDRPLSSLRLEAGPLTLDEQGDPPKTPQSIFQRTVSDEDEGGWMPVSVLPEGLQFNLPKPEGGDDPCRPLEVSTYAMPSNKRVTVALPQFGGRVFAVTVDGQGYMIDDTDITEIGPVVPDAVLSGVEVSDGVTWLSGHDGRLWSGVPTGSFANTHTLRPRETIRYLAGPAPGMDVPAPTELLALSSTGTLSQLGYWGGWRSDLPLTRAERPSSREGGLLWLGLDRSAALVPGTGEFFRIDVGVPTAYDVPEEQVGTLDTIAANYGGVFGMTDNGYLLRFTEIGQTVTIETKLDNKVSDPQLVSLPDGFLIVNRPSTVRFWYRPSALEAGAGQVPPNVICPEIVVSEAGDSILWAHTIVGEKAYLFLSPFVDWDSGPTTMAIVDFSRPL